MASPPVPAATLAMRQRIGDILMSDACQKIDFRWGPYHIDGWGYTAVALSLAGRSHSLKLAFGHLPAHAGAEYDPDLNQIRLPSTAFAAPGNAGIAWQRMAIVHECTHAVVDQLRLHARNQHGSRVLYRSNEVLAQVAGALFNNYSGSPFTPTDPIDLAADAIAKAIKDSPGSIIGPSDKIKALEDAITSNAAYKFLVLHPHTMVTNSGLPF